jgi:hypothetical protein
MNFQAWAILLIGNAAASDATSRRGMLLRFSDQAQLGPLRPRRSEQLTAADAKIVEERFRAH